MFEFLCDRAINDPYNQKGSFPYNPRFTALEAIIEHYPDHPGAIALLQARSMHDTDEQVRDLASRKLRIK
jgi:hypothetical protein